MQSCSARKARSLSTPEENPDHVYEKTGCFHSPFLFVGKVFLTLPTKRLRFEPRFFVRSWHTKSTLSAQSVFPDVHAAGKNVFEFVFGLRAESDAGLGLSFKKAEKKALKNS